MTQGYCVKERKKVEIKDAKQVTMKNGRPAIQGVCPDCGTNIIKLGKMEEPSPDFAKTRKPGALWLARREDQGLQRFA
jgi:hypothetical protein